MKRINKWICVLLCAVLFVMPFPAFAEDESETEVVTEVDTTAPHGSLSRPETTDATVTAAPKSVDPPLVKITRGDLAKKPKPNETFTVTVIFHNYSGDVSLRSGLASFETSDGLVLMENSASKVVPVIDPSGVWNVKLKLRVTKDCADANQSVSVTYKYSYRTPEGLADAEASEKLLMTVVPASSEKESEAKPASATPNIIVSDYNYGGTITAGDSFTLRLQFRNTSRNLSAENIVMSVEAGTGLSITSASNTYYYASLGAGQTKTQSIPMRVASNADPEGAKIEISFHYEYVDGSSRSNADTSERLSVPIFIPDRFSVSAPEMDLIGTQDQELSVSLPYVNKSRVDVCNVSAELLFDEQSVSCEQSRVNLGNIEPGKSGTIDFFFTPLQTGNASVTVKITYEDEMTKEKTIEVKVPYFAEEGYMDIGMDMPMEEPEEESSSPGWLKWAIVAGAVLVVLIVIIVIVARKKKKKKAAEPSIDFDWGAPQEVNSHEDR